MKGNILTGNKTLIYLSLRGHGTAEENKDQITMNAR